jgi:RNA polymerase sigma-70 factor (ECF subfamily)
MTQAETVLTLAARRQSPGRFQLEAAIQSVHAQRAHTGETNWPAIARLYEALIRQTPALGARLGHVVALAKSHGAAAGLDALDDLPTGPLQTHQPYWATRAWLLRELGETAEARAAYTRAIGLTEDAAVRAFLNAQM